MTWPTPCGRASGAKGVLVEFGRAGGRLPALFSYYNSGRDTQSLPRYIVTKLKGHRVFGEGFWGSTACLRY